MNIELPLDGIQRERVRPLSKALFHSEYALEAYLLIGTSPRFYKAQMAELTGCQPSFASTFILRLEKEGLIERVPTEDGQRRHYLRKTPLPIWDALTNLAVALLADVQDEEAEVTPLPQRP